MKHLQRISIFSIGTVVILAAFAFRWEENPFYYANGNKLYWQPQYDMYAFRTVGEDAFKGQMDTSVVERVEFRNNYPDKLHLVFFKQNSSNWQRLQVIDDIERDVQFARSFPVVTMFDYTPSDAGLWYVADDLLMVMFKNDSLRKAHLPRLLDEYNLTQINDPSQLPAGGNYAYILKWDIYDTSIQNSLGLSSLIYERDSALLWSVEPNLIRGYEPVWVEDSTATSVQSLDSESSAAMLYVVNQGNTTLNVYFEAKAPQFYFRMYDLFGRLLTERHLSTNDTRVDIGIAHLSGGIYFGTLETRNGEPMATVKWVKE